MNSSNVLKSLTVKAKKESMLPIEKLEKLVGEPDSGIEKERQEVHVALHPRYVNSIALGLVNHFNHLINQWHPKLKGILAGYGRLQLKRPTGHMINESADIHLDVQSDFWIFRPLEGRQLKGVVTKKSSSHVSCLVHGVFNVPCHRPNNLNEEWWGSKVQPKQIVHFTVLKTDMSQKVPFILGDLQNDGLDGNLNFDETVPSPLVEEVEDDDWSDVINHETNMSVFNEEPSEKSKKKKNKSEKKLLNESKDKSDAESMDLDSQRKNLISSVLDSSILNDSTTSSTSSKKNKKRKHKEDEKVSASDTNSKDEKETEKTRETLISSILLNGTPGKKSKKKKKDKDKDREKEGEESQSKNAEGETEVENAPKNDISELLNSSMTNEKKKKKKDKNRTVSPQPDTTPAIVPKSPKKSPKKSPVKEAKKETVVKKAPVSEANKNVKKAVASPAGKKTKDPNAPKMPTTAYMQFNKEQRLKLTDAGQKVNIIEFAKECGQRWRELSPEQQQPYKDLADKDKKRYEIDMAAYKEGNYIPPQNNDKKVTAIKEKPAEPDTSQNDEKTKKKKDKKTTKISITFPSNIKY